VFLLCRWWWNAQIRSFFASGALKRFGEMTGVTETSNTVEIWVIAVWTAGWILQEMSYLIRHKRLKRKVIPYPVSTREISGGKEEPSPHDE
jgi:hypothetical protein